MSEPREKVFVVISESPLGVPSNQAIIDLVVDLISAGPGILVEFDENLGKIVISQDGG